MQSTKEWRNRGPGIFEDSSFAGLRRREREGERSSLESLCLGSAFVVSRSLAHIVERERERERERENGAESEVCRYLYDCSFERRRKRSEISARIGEKWFPFSTVVLFHFNSVICVHITYLDPNFRNWSLYRNVNGTWLL